MSRIVIATWAGGGNVPPALALAQEFQRRGHEVLIMGHPQQTVALEGHGVAFEGYRGARPFEPTTPPNPLTLIRTFGDVAMGAEVAAQSADLIVVDCMLTGVMHVLARRGIRYVVLEHLFDQFLLGPAAKGPIPLGLRFLGIRPRALLEAAALRIVATLPELDSPTGANAAQVGPFVSGTPATPTEPTILLSLSTYPYPGMARAWQRALDALAQVDARVIATTGPMIAAGTLRVGANTEIHNWLPHAEVMSQVSMVFGHGGHSTTMLALAHDLPLVLMPMFGMVDQPMVARAVQRAGAGRHVRKSAPSEHLRTVVAGALTTSSYREAAARLGARIRDLDGCRRAATAIEALF